MKSTIRSKLIQIISDMTGLKGKEITMDLPLMDDGLLTSLQVVELSSRIEKDLGILIEDQEIIPENFSSLRAIEELLSRKKESLEEQN